MSNSFGMFEADEATQRAPQANARLAARKMDAAIDVVRSQFGRFLLGATGIDEFGDRWHYSKHDIRAAVEPYVFPNTGTMRRLHNALKQDWKIAHPYKLAEDRDAPIQDIQETYQPSSGNLIPEGDFEEYKSRVDQGGPEKVDAHDFTPGGGDSGSDRHARRRQAGGGVVWNGGLVDPMSLHSVSDGGEDDTPGGGVVWKGRPVDPMWLRSVSDDEDSRKEAARLVADIYTDFARSNGLRVASLDTLDAYASTGLHEADYRLLQSMIIRAAEDEDSDDDDDDDESEEPDSESGEVPNFGGDDDHEEPDADDAGGESDGDEDNEAESDDSEASETEGDDDDYGFGDDGGEETGGGETYTVPEHAPELDPAMMQEIPTDDPQGSAPVPPEVIDSLLGLPEGTIEQLLLEEVEQGQGGAPQGGGDDFLGGAGGDNTEPPRVARRRQAGQVVDGVDWDDAFRNTVQDWPDWSHEQRQKFMSDAMAAGVKRPDYHIRRDLDIGKRPTAARSFWAAEDDQQPQDDPSGGQPPQGDPSQGGGAPPMGGGMMPPPGSQAVAPPQPPAPLENQPAEDALLDTANQAIMQMIDRETQEYQQIIDPLSQALQAVQFAQQVEQSEHPMDVTPPQGTVDVSPAAAPGGQAPQQPMQQMARRRVAGGDPYADSYGDIDRGGPSIDDPGNGPTYQRVHPDIEKALRRRFDGGGSAGWHPDKPGVILHDLGNFWDGPREVRHLGGGELEYTNPWNQRSDRFNAAGYYTHDGEHRPWSSDHYSSMRRQAKVETILRNAAAVIAARYRLSATGHQMLVEATLGRRGYEHVVEALRLVPPEVRKAAAIHMSHLFAAGNQRFNKDVFLKTVMASNPRDRAGDAWRDGRDRGIAEHGRHDMEDVGYLDLHPSPGKPRTLRDRLSEGADSDWVDGSDRKASRSRLPFELPRRQAGETLTPTPTMDAFEFPNAGVTPRVDDNNDFNNLPKMTGADPHGKNAASQKAVDRFQRWRQRQQQQGLPTTDGEAAVHNFLQTRNPVKKRVGPDAQNMIHEHLGLQPDAVKTPKAKPVKAVNPVLKGKGATPSAPKAKAPAPKAAPKTASFFTRRVPGWRWDDHLNGYLAKEARDFSCSCGQKVAAPSYKTCDCGKVWNVYAIGDTHHLASDTAEVFIAREIPVRPGVVMANRKMAGFNDTHAIITEHDTAQNAFLDSGHPADKEYLDQVRGELMERAKAGDPDAIEWSKGRSNFDPDKEQDPFDPRLIGAARKSHRELLAEIERLADWTKYDSPDPSRDPKAKPPSTAIPKQPKDWTNREFTGPDKGQWREPDPTELPRKTRKKK